MRASGKTCWGLPHLVFLTCILLTSTVSTKFTGAKTVPNIFYYESDTENLQGQQSHVELLPLSQFKKNILQSNDKGGQNRIWKKCELVKELLKRQGFPRNNLHDWACLVFWESGYNTAKVNKNTGGSKDYGIFQINDNYWCGSGGKSNDCKVDCDALLTDDITTSATCAMKIYLDKLRKKGNGFLAWYGWIDHCSNGRAKVSDLDDCILDLDGSWIGSSYNTDGFHSPVQLTCDSSMPNDQKCSVLYTTYPCKGVWHYQSVAGDGGIKIYEDFGGRCFAVQMVATVSGNTLNFKGYLPAEPHVTVYGTLTRQA